MNRRSFSALALKALLSVFSAVIVVFASLTLQAQEGGAVTGQLLDMTIGVDDFETIPSMNGEPDFRGDFRKVVKVAYSSSNHELRLTPYQQGTASLSIFDAKGRKVLSFLLSVKKSNVNRVAKEIQSLLGEIEGIQIRIANNRVVVDGEVYVVKDISRVQSVVAQYGDLASSLVRLSPIAQRKIAEIIERDINDPEIHVRAPNGIFVLEGVAADEAAKTGAELIAKVYVPDVVVTAAKGVKPIMRAPILNRITLRAAPPPEPDKIVQIVIHYVELDKDYENGFRFQWMPGIADNTQVQFQTGGQGSGGLVSTITGTVSNLLPKLNYAKEHGHARVLQSSSIVTESGHEATIEATRDIPYQIVGPQGQPSTEFKKDGITTVITPRVVSPSSDSINLDVKFDIGALSGANGMISHNTIKTVVTVKSGQSAAIGGLVTNSSGTDYNKLPAGSSSNPLISLYASKSFRRQQTQFVVFVTPVIKASASSGSEAVKKKFRLNN